MRTVFPSWPQSAQAATWCCLLALVCGGCAPRTKLSVWRPAGVDIGGIERLTILDFDGEKESGRIARSALQAKFWENKHYTLVEPAELARVKPITLPDGRTDVAAAIDAGRMLGVDALLHGQVVSYNVADDVQTSHHVEIFGGSSANSKTGDRGSSGGLGLDTTQTLTREASVSLAIKLIDVRSGEIRAARQFAHTFHGQRVNGSGDLPGRERILTELLHHCSEDAVAMLAPHYVTQEVKLARQYWGKGLNQLKQGNGLAKKGDWAAAETAWQAAARDNPTNHAARYNLALAAMARQDYPAARRQVDEAIKGYAAQEYQQLKRELMSRERDFQAALAQVNSRRNRALIAGLPPPPGMTPAGTLAQAPPPAAPSMSPAFPAAMPVGAPSPSPHGMGFPTAGPVVAAPAVAQSPYPSPAQPASYPPAASAPASLPPPPAAPVGYPSPPATFATVPQSPPPGAWPLPSPAMTPQPAQAPSPAEAAPVFLLPAAEPSAPVNSPAAFPRAP